MRPLAQQFVSLEIHNGQTVRFWTDLWHPLGILIKVAAEIGTQKLGIARSAFVCELWNDGGWVFRRSCDRKMGNLVQAVETHKLADDCISPDVVLWKRSATEFGKHFSIAEIWKQTRLHNPIMSWSKVVWFPLGVPRFCFYYMACNKEHAIYGERVRGWGQVQGFLFCGVPNESRDHMFFACPYTYTI